MAQQQLRTETWFASSWICHCPGKNEAAFRPMNFRAVAVLLSFHVRRLVSVFSCREKNNDVTGITKP
jgi:hypothetical protein